MQDHLGDRIRLGDADGVRSTPQDAVELRSSSLGHASVARGIGPVLEDPGRRPRPAVCRLFALHLYSG